VDFAEMMETENGNAEILPASYCAWSSC